MSDAQERPICSANLNDSISPSVYVIYSSIHASASCVALVNSHIPIGSFHTAVTRAYNPNVLSSAICEAENMGAGIEYCISPVNDQNNPAYCFQGIDNGWRQIDFSELYDPPPASALLPRYQSCFPGHSISADFASMMFVKPQLAFPPDVTDIDPVWATWGGSTCTPVNLGVFDPPRLLQKATALAPVATPAADPHPQAEKPPPSPAATLRSPVAAPTKSVTGSGSDNGAKANDPGSNNAVTPTSPSAQSDPAPIVDPVDPLVVASNLGSPATGNSDPAKAGSKSSLNSDPVNAGVISDAKSDPSSGTPNSDPVASGGDTKPADSEMPSEAMASADPGTQSGADSGTENNDPAIAPITLLPLEKADSAKESSGTSGSSGSSGAVTGDTNGGADGGITGGSDGATSGGSDGGTSRGTNGDASGGSKGENSGDTNTGSTDTNGGASGGTDKTLNGETDNSNASPSPIASVRTFRSLSFHPCLALKRELVLRIWNSKRSLSSSFEIRKGACPPCSTLEREEQNILSGTRG